MSAILVVDDSLTVRMDLIEALDAAGLRAVGCATRDRRGRDVLLHAAAAPVAAVRARRHGLPGSAWRNCSIAAVTSAGSSTGEE